LTRRLKNWVAAHSVLAMVLVTLVFAGGAAAAWITYTATVSGTAGGTIATNQSLSKLLFASDGSVTPTSVEPCSSGTGATCTGGVQGTIPYSMTNRWSGNVTVTSLSVVLTTSDDTSPDFCKNHLFTIAASLPVTGTYGTGLVTAHGLVQYVADPSLPVGCSAATVTATFTGATN
jgi:hypothetical protein